MLQTSAPAVSCVDTRVSKRSLRVEQSQRHSLWAIRQVSAQNRCNHPQPTPRLVQQHRARLIRRLITSRPRLFVRSELHQRTNRLHVALVCRYVQRRSSRSRLHLFVRRAVLSVSIPLPIMRSPLSALSLSSAAVWGRPWRACRAPTFSRSPPCRLATRRTPCTTHSTRSSSSWCDSIPSLAPAARCSSPLCFCGWVPACHRSAVYDRRQEKHTRAYSLSAFLRAKTPGV